jgi:hypothetical protein
VDDRLPGTAVMLCAVTVGGLLLVAGCWCFVRYGTVRFAARARNLGFFSLVLYLRDQDDVSVLKVSLEYTAVKGLLEHTKR